MAVYYNEFDPYAAQWLRNLIEQNLIASGDVDERSIVDVSPDDLKGYTQCHFFAGIGGWSYAARLAGWPDDRELWTGSCPCQPFSRNGARRGTRDPRHLWPSFHRLIVTRKPSAVAGEQVAGADGLEWVDGVQTDMEGCGYSFWSAVIAAGGFGAPHKRDRIYFVADTQGNRRQGENLHPPRGLPTNRTPQSGWGNFVGLQSGASTRRIGTGIELLAHGVPARVGKLRAYGNAIVPQVAAEVIGAYMAATLYNSERTDG